MQNANPERFKGEMFGPFGWALRDYKSAFDTSECCWKDELDSIWAFIGPLAVELGVHRVTLECPLTGDKYADLLEATFAAVCDRLEAA